MTVHATEQERPDILNQRWAWFESQLDLDPDRLVFIDETWASTNMVRRHGRCQGVSGFGPACRMAIGRRRRSSPACATPA